VKNVRHETITTFKSRREYHKDDLMCSRHTVRKSIKDCIEAQADIEGVMNLELIW
jgi:hypothetical protein